MIIFYIKITQGELKYNIEGNIQISIKTLGK
jgi:uncharacterized lipoprotein YajG